jgi:hypothetical protein
VCSRLQSWSTLVPRYFFHVHDGAELPDEDGTELPDLASARNEAVRLAGASLKDHAQAFWNEEQWSIDVTDEDGLMLFSLTFFATNAPATRVRS